MRPSSTRSWRSPSRPRRGRKSAKPTTSLVVLGRGRLGQSLAAATGARLLPGKGASASDLEPGDRIFMTVPDPAIAETAGRLVAAGLPPGAALVHCSGALGLDVLAAATAQGVPAGSFHPLQSFPVVRGPEAFAGALVAVDATTPELLDELNALARSLGATPRRVRGEERTLYHASAVLASSHLAALTAEAVSALAHLGWSREEALSALLPLQRGTLENLERVGLPDALIGPIRRGDHETVARQVRALDAAGLESAARAYRILGIAALALARQAGLDTAAAQRIEEALTG